MDTLLMVLFIVMFAMSTVDRKKFNALKAELAAGFGQSTSVLDGSSSILDQPGTAPVAPINPNRIQASPGIEQIKSTAATQTLAEQQQRAYAEAGGEADRLLGIGKQLTAALKAKGLDDDVRTKIDGRALTDRLQIEGHTNQAPGKPKYYASDWNSPPPARSPCCATSTSGAASPTAGSQRSASATSRRWSTRRSRRPQKLNKRVEFVMMSALSKGAASSSTAWSTTGRTAPRTPARVPATPAPPPKSPEDTGEEH